MSPTNEFNDLKEQLQRWAYTQRLEGNYVAAQMTERLLSSLQPSTYQTQPLAVSR